MSKPANIILIVVDSLRYDHVGPQGGRASLTPELDQLAARGIVFSQAISQGPSTRVSMSALMSSTYASLYGGQLRLSPDRPVIQAMLRDAGYQTAAVVSNLYLSRTFGWSRGFDHYDDCRPEAFYHRKPWLRVANQVTRRLGLPLGWPKTLPAPLMFENAGLYLRQARAPFFLWTHLMDVHWPYTLQKFSWDAEWRRKRAADDRLRPRMLAQPPELSAAEGDTLAEEYRAAIRYTDAHIGAFVRQLARAGRLADSWLVITADHGEEFHEHGQFFHHPILFDELVHVPLLVRPPDSLAAWQGRRYDAQVRLIDLVPTFLEIAGAAAPEGVHLFGASLLPVLRGAVPPADRPAVSETPDQRTLAVRHEGWKYMWQPAVVERGRLYDLRQDPGEQHDCAAEHPEQASALHAMLVEHLDVTRGAARPAPGENGHGEKAAVQAAEPEVDETIIQRLRDLGYVE